MIARHRLALSASAVAAAAILNVHATQIAHEPFAYAGGVNLTTETADGGSGWTAAWESTGISGLVTSGTSRSLWFGQDPVLASDGSNHVFSDLNRGNRRDFTTAVNLGSQTLYFTALVHVYAGAGVVDLRAEFWDGAGASGNMRGNVGISDGDLYVHASSSGYKPVEAGVAAGLVANETTYLLAMKRTGTGISAALIPATGDLGSLASEPAWQATHAGVSAVSLRSIRFIANGTGGGIRIDELRIATSWSGAVDGLAIPEPEKTFVFSVDQEATTEAQSWTHTVAEAGNYQIGCAWAETLSGGNVAVEVFHNSMRVKALYAPPGEVTRFETRLENLAAGDEITVRAIPNGSSYRLGYQIAFGTPTFAGLPVFDVAAYGAIGDGVTDDMEAIRAAVAAARQAGGGIVTLDGTKTYRAIGLNDLTYEFLFQLNGAVNLSIEGNGATILLHPPDGLADIQYAENVRIDGLKVDFLPRPYYQGTITGIDVANLTIDLTVPERYPVPLTGPAPTHAPFFGRSFIPDAPGARSGRGDNIYVASVSQLGSERELRIQVPEFVGEVPMAPRVQNAFDNNATEFVVPHLIYGHLGGVSRIQHSARVTLSNIHQVCAPYFWISILHNIGPVTLTNVDLRMDEPETELLASWRDGMHIKNGRWGIMIEEGDWDGAAMYDDTFALYTRTQKLVGVAGNVATLTPSFEGRETFLWKAGDWASFWSPDQGVMRGMARVIGAMDVAAPNYEVTFESLPAGIEPDDIVILEEAINRGTVIRNSRTTSIGTEDSSTRFRGTSVLFQDNHFEDFGFRLEYEPALATPRARDVVIEDCYLQINPQEGGRVILTRPLGVRFLGGVIDATEVFGHLGANDILLDGVAFENMTGSMLNLAQNSTAWMFGSTSRNGSTSGLSSSVQVDGTSTVTYSAPTGYLPAVPPSNGEDTVAPDAPMGVVVSAKDSQVWLDWERSSSPDIHAYKVYRSTTAGGPYTEAASGLLVSKWIDDGVSNGTTYHYVVTALDNSGNESAFSDELSITAGPPVDLVFEDFNYPDATALEGGISRGGLGWIGGWEAIGGGGLSTINGRLGGSGSATRSIQNTFALNPPDTWLSFLARSDGDGAFSLDLKQTSGEFIRWAFARNADGSVTVKGGDVFATSAPGLFGADTDYLVLSRFDTSTDTAYFKLIDILAPGDLSVEPSQWDISADGLTGVTIDRIDIHVSGGNVTLDELRLGRTFTSIASLPPGYPAWAGSHALMGGPEDDDDGDSLANLLEYALGGNPKNPADRGHPLLSDVTQDGENVWLEFTYPKRSDAQRGLKYAAEISETLQPDAWTEEGIELVEVVENGFGPGFDAVTLRAPATGKNRLFIRLRAGLP